MFFVIVSVFCGLSLPWIFHKVLSSFIIMVGQKWLGLDIRIRNVGYLSLKNIQIVFKSSCCISIDEVWLSSRFINHSVRHPLAFCFGELRVNASSSSDIYQSDDHHDVSHTFGSNTFIMKLLPVFKFVGLWFDHMSFVLNRILLENSIVHISVQQLVPEVTHSSLERCLTLSCHVKLVSLKVLHSGLQVTENHPCSFGLQISPCLKVHFPSAGRFCIKKLDVNLLNCHMQITEGFLRQIHDARQMHRAAVNVHSSSLTMLVPKAIVIRVNHTEVAYDRVSLSRCLYGTLVSLHIDVDHELQPANNKVHELNAYLKINDLFINSAKHSLVAASEVSSQFKIANSIGQANVDCNGCFIGYYDDEMSYWRELFMEHPHVTDAAQELSCTHKIQSLAKFLQLESVFVVSHMTHSSVTVTSTAGIGLHAGISDIKTSCSLRVLSEDMTSSTASEVTLEATTVYCQAIDGKSGSYPNELGAKLHHWDTVLFTEIFIAKVSHLTDELSCDMMVDSVQLEFSPNVLSAMEAVARILEPLFVIDENHLVERRTKSTTSILPLNRMHGCIQCTNSNIFITCHNAASATLRCDSISLQCHADDMTLSLSGLKVVSFIRQSESVVIKRCADIFEYVGHIKSFHVDFNNIKQCVEIRIKDDLFICWNMAVHMCFHHAVADIYSTLLHIQGTLQHQKAGSPSSWLKTCKHVVVTIEANSHVMLHLSSKHRLAFNTTALSVSKVEHVNICCQQLDVCCDGHVVFTIQGIVINYDKADDHLLMERSNTKTLSLDVNRAWIISADSIDIVFPYNYSFAEWFEQLKNVNKWRKSVYRKSEKAFGADSCLPPDLHISIKSASLQLCDDPFEVKLGDIYKLMKDEYAESEKRLEVMEERIETLKRKQGLVPAEKIETAYESLLKKTTNIYIQRARQLYHVAPPCTSLFLWKLNEVEVIALADPSYHGHDNVVNVMRQIDPDSPFPEADLEFTSLFCRTVNASAHLWTFHLRDFPEAMLDIHDLHIWGRLVGAEPLGIERARRNCTIEIGEPWGEIMIERNMPSIKFYHDFNADVKSFDMAYGPCWEPTWAQVNLALNLISRSSLDPSQPLPFWDKIRLWIHGRLTMSIEHTTWLYHASLDPYNRTEFMDWSWTNFILDWTNANLLFHGDLDIYSKTASKYDDCRLLHLPGVRLCVNLQWLCIGDPNAHHTVMPCAPDKVPEYSHKEHDSYRAFRSYGLSVTVTAEVALKFEADVDCGPSCLFYNSTVRWIDKVKMCIARVSRPIRRGKLFNNVTARKLQLSRHLHEVKLSFSVPKFCLCYWASFAKQNGAEMTSDLLHINVGLKASNSPWSGNQLLKRRPMLVWYIRQFDVHLKNANLHLISTSLGAKKKERLGTCNDVLKSFLLSLEILSYQRAEEMVIEDRSDSNNKDKPIHHLIVDGLKGSWTPGNRSIAVNLYDSYSKAQVLKRNLGAEALKGFRVESSQMPQESVLAHDEDTRTESVWSDLVSSPEPSFNMLQKLVNESDSKFVVTHEELSGRGVQIDQLSGIVACQMNDVTHHKWHVELYNSQVLLRGCETNGYLIASAAKTSLLSCDHKPFWSDQQLKSKTTLVGSVECMQYYATVDAGPAESSDCICWLTKENIEDRPATGSFMSDINDEEFCGMIGSGQSVGGVVSETVSSHPLGSCIQLQRIISHCRCQFFYAWYGDVEDDTLHEVPVPPNEDTDVMKCIEGVDAFTLLHHELKICTNSLQYATVLDIVNNLLLYVEPRKKELIEKLQTMRFRLQLASIEDQRTPIPHLQDNLRHLVARVRQLERELYFLEHRFCDEGDGIVMKCNEVQKALEETKEQVNLLSEELSIMVSCLRETQLQLTHLHTLTVNKPGVEVTSLRPVNTVRRRYEVCFERAEWRMTEEDGQIGLADLELTTFLYTKINYESESGCHQLELGDFKVTNLMSDGNHLDVLAPQGSDICGQMALRVLCKFKAPVGGISVKEHFEVNLVPLVIQLTARFYSAVMAFFFPGRTDENDEDDTADAELFDSEHDDAKGVAHSHKSVQHKLSPPSLGDLDKMKERAAKNNMFLYVKVPQVPLRVSYKSHKDKHILNITDFVFFLPTLEYHNHTWTWLDLAMAVKNDCKKVIIAQAVRQKLHIKPRLQLPESFLPKGHDPEADKAKLLMGERLAASNDKTTFGKKSPFSGKFTGK